MLVLRSAWWANCFLPAVEAAQSGGNFITIAYFTLLILPLEFFLECVWIADVIIIMIIIEMITIIIIIIITNKYQQK